MAGAEMAVETLNVIADQGYYDGEELRTCEEAGITVTLPKPMTSGASRDSSAWQARPISGRARQCEDFVQLCTSCFALSGVIAVVGTVTTVGTFSAQSSRIDFAISIASGPPVG
jgi:hypothetical protein